MSYAQQMLETYPRPVDVDPQVLAGVVDTLFDCAQACSACADACMAESDPATLSQCIRANLDCADQCVVAGRVLSRQTGYDANITRAVLEAAAQVCQSCGDECEHHASAHEHCRVCAEACRRCEEACRKALDAMS